MHFHYHFAKTLFEASALVSFHIRAFHTSSNYHQVHEAHAITMTFAQRRQSPTASSSGDSHTKRHLPPVSVRRLLRVHEGFIARHRSLLSALGFPVDMFDSCRFTTTGRGMQHYDGKQMPPHQTRICRAQENSYHPAP
jgi:hypothetical protein